MSLHIFNCIYIDGFVAVWKQKPAVASQRYVFVSAVTCLILNLHTAILVSYRTFFLKQQNYLETTVAEPCLNKVVVFSDFNKISEESILENLW